jgi:hypothetical protein
MRGIVTSITTAPEANTTRDDLRSASLSDERGQSEYRVHLTSNMRGVEVSRSVSPDTVCGSLIDTWYMRDLVTSETVAPEGTVL